MNELSIHPAGAADYGDFVRLFAELQIDDPLPNRADWLVQLAPHTLFLSNGATNVAYAVAHTYGDAAYLAQVAVDPAERRRGVGRLLMRRLAERLRADGCKAWRLNVKVGNEPAIRLYAGLGLEVHRRGAVLRLPWSIADLLPPGGGGAAALGTGERDAELERLADLIDGQIGRWRAQRDLLFCLPDDRGFARYVPTLGSMPFQAADLRAARALLEAMHPHAPRAATHVQVVIQGQDDLASSLRAAGAALVFAFFQMRGPLPD